MTKSITKKELQTILELCPDDVIIKMSFYDGDNETPTLVPIIAFTFRQERTEPIHLVEPTTIILS